MKATTEAEIQHAILTRFGADPRLRLWRSNSGAARTRSGRMVKFNFPGCPDLSGFLAGSGRAFFVEVKSASGRQSPAQRAFQTICERFGAVYVLARCSADVENALRAWTKIRGDLA